MLIKRILLIAWLLASIGSAELALHYMISHPHEQDYFIIVNVVVGFISSLASAVAAAIAAMVRWND